MKKNMGTVIIEINTFTLTIKDVQGIAFFVFFGHANSQRWEHLRLSYSISTFEGSYPTSGKGEKHLQNGLGQGDV